jgi:DNA-directed RNA polymerase specialized sigma24 family protein
VKLPLTLDDQQFALLADEAVGVSCQYEERREALRVCLQSLSHDNRQLLDSRYAMDQSVTGIAEKLGRSRVAIYKRLGRIQGLLLNCINGRLEVEGSV